MIEFRPSQGDPRSPEMSQKGLESMPSNSLQLFSRTWILAFSAMLLLPHAGVSASGFEFADAGIGHSGAGLGANHHSSGLDRSSSPVEDSFFSAERWSSLRPFIVLDSHFSSDLADLDSAGMLIFVDTVRQAVRALPQVAVERSREERAAAALLEARAQWLPQISAGLEHREALANTSRQGFDAGSRTDAVLNVSQRLWDFGAATSRVEAADRLVEAQQSAIGLTTEEWLQRSLGAWYDVIRYRSQREVTEDYLERTEAILGLVRERTEGGLGSVADRLRAESRVLDAQSQLIALLGREQRAAAEFRQIFGSQVSHAQLPEIRIFLAAVQPAAGEGVFDGLDVNLSLRRQQSELQAALAEARAARSDRWPTFSLNLEGRRFDIANSTNLDSLGRESATLFVRGDYSLYSGGAGRAREAQARARARELALATVSLRDDLERLVRMQEAEWLALRAELPARVRAVVADAMTVETYMDQFSIGRRSLSELLDAERDLFLNAVALIDRRIDHDLSWFRLQGLSGQLLTLFVLP